MDHWVSVLSFHILYAKSLQSRPILCDPVDCSRQDPLSIEFSRQEYRSEQPFPSPGTLPNAGIEPGCPAFRVDSEPPGKPTPEASQILSNLNVHRGRQIKDSYGFTFAYTRSKALFFLLEKHHFPFFLISPFDAYLALPVLIQIFFCFKTTTERLYKRDEARSPLMTCWGNSGKRVKRRWFYMSARWWRLNTGRSSDFFERNIISEFLCKMF